MSARGAAVRCLAAALLLAAASRPEASADENLLAATKKQWEELDRGKKIDALTRLGAQPSHEVLAQCGRWLDARQEDALVRAEVVRLVAHHYARKAYRARARALLERFVRRRLEIRRRLEEAEFRSVCREHGRKLPPADRMAAGADWTDPWDEERRELPAAVRRERALMRAVVAALEGTGSRDFFPTLAQVFREHHDPEVVLRVVEAFASLKEWRALPALADLARIQRYGREVGGSHVIGEKSWRTLRLKWDVHKDRLWWSRPEYMPRTVRPILRAAATITGGRFDEVADLDAWLLGHGPELEKHGVRLTDAFRTRARSTQR